MNKKQNFNDSTFKIDTCLPEEVGIPSKALSAFLNRLDREGLPLHSVLMVRHGKLFLENYYAPYQANTLHRMFSITKSFTAAAILLLEEEGKLSLDDPIVSYFPEFLPPVVHPWLQQTTIRHMLTMRSCHDATTYKLDLESNWVESFFTVLPTNPPGRIFHYDTSSSHTLTALAEKLTGMDMLDYLKEKYLRDAGFSEHSYLLKDPFGTSIGGSGLMATPRDLLCFAKLLIDKKYWTDKKIIREESAQDAVSALADSLVTASNLSESQGYGYQIWRIQNNGFACFGMGGQYLLHYPDLDFTCVITEDTQGIDGGNQAIFQALFQEIFPFMDKDFVTNPEDQKELVDIITESQIRPLELSLNPAACFTSGTIYELEPNKHNFTKVQLNIDENHRCGALNYTLNGEDYCIPFGLGQMEIVKFPGYDQTCAVSGTWLKDHTFYIKCHVIDEYVGSVHFQLSFSEKDLTMYVKKKEESLFREYEHQHLYGIPDNN